MEKDKKNPKNAELPKKQKLILQVTGRADISDYRSFLLERIAFPVDIRIEEVAKASTYVDVLVEFPSKASSRRATDVLHESNYKHSTEIWCYHYIPNEKMANNQPRVNQTSKKREIKEKKPSYDKVTDLSAEEDTKTKDKSRYMSNKDSQRTKTKDKPRDMSDKKSEGTKDKPREISYKDSDGTETEGKTRNMSNKDSKGTNPKDKPRDMSNKDSQGTKPKDKPRDMSNKDSQGTKPKDKPRDLSNKNRECLPSTRPKSTPQEKNNCGESTKTLDTKYVLDCSGNIKTTNQSAKFKASGIACKVQSSLDDLVTMEPSIRKTEHYADVSINEPDTEKNKSVTMVDAVAANGYDPSIAQEMILELHVTDCNSEDQCQNILRKQFGSSVRFSMISFEVQSEYNRAKVELPSKTMYRKTLKNLYSKRIKLIDSYPKSRDLKTNEDSNKNRRRCSDVAQSIKTNNCDAQSKLLPAVVTKGGLEENGIGCFQLHPLDMDTIIGIEPTSASSSVDLLISTNSAQNGNRDGHRQHCSTSVNSKISKPEISMVNKEVKQATNELEGILGTGEKSTEMTDSDRHNISGNNENIHETDDKDYKKKRAKDFIHALNTKFKPQSVEVEIKNVKNAPYDDKAVETLLNKRLLYKEPFTLKALENVHGTAFVTVEFLSTNSSKRAMDILLKSNSTNYPQIKCYIDKERKLQNQASLRRKRLSNLASQLADAAKPLLDEHNSRLSDIQVQVDEIAGKKKNKKFQSLLQFESKKIEKEALMSKKEELENQVKEFKSFIKVFHDRLETIKDTAYADEDLLELETTFTVECDKFSAGLPIYARRADIINTIAANQTTVILGETGSGKSTQVVQYLYQTGQYAEGIIVCTQPRKVAAISLATRVAKELSSNVGHLVGYQVGMQTKKTKDTKIMYMTDHVLLNECLRDPTLQQYSCIIIDEAHERSIYTDLLLGMLKNSLSTRKDLRVVITSATISPDVFVQYFDNHCPVLKVSGRLFPVDIEWCDENCDDSYEKRTLQKAIEVHMSEPPGDVLVFLTSPIEVEKCCKQFEEKLRKHKDFVCFPLHGKLHSNEQQKVFSQTPRGKRKVVFATNSAETSITIPGIKYVIDSGRIKEMQFDAKKNISSLVVTLVTKSSANQRSGRAGRTAPGKCFRLYSESEFKSMKACSTPEILRVNLGQALINLLELDVDPLSFDFVESPPKEQIHSAMDTLESIGATSDGKLTELGKWIAKLPFDPIYGVFVNEALDQNVGIESLIITACCGCGGSLFYRPGSNEEKSNADKIKVRFAHAGGDVLTMLNAFREWHDQPEALKGKWCVNNYVNGKTMKFIRETVTEAIAILKKELKVKIEFKLGNPQITDNLLQKMLFKMFKHNICHFLGHDKAGYHVLNKGVDVCLFPTSALSLLNIQSEWIVIEQVLQVSRDFAVNATPVLEEWIEEGLKDGWLRPLLLDRAKQQKVVCTFTRVVGEFSFRGFVGPRYSCLKDLELKLRNETKSTVIIDANSTIGEISVFSSHENENKTKLKGYIDGMLNPIIDKLKHEKSEQYLSSAKRGTRVVVSAGCNIDSILMSNEYKTIIVACDNPNHTASITEEDVENIFLNYGNIERIEKFSSTHKRNWGRVTFMLPEEAEEAVQETKEEFVYALPTGNVRLQNEHRVKAKFEWCRRRSRGVAFVEFSDDRIPQNILEDFCEMDIVGCTAELALSKTDVRQIRVNRLDKFVNEAVLRHVFVTKFNLRDDHVVRASVCRERVVTSREEYRTIIRRLSAMIEPHVKKGKYELHVKPPNEKDFTFLAFASFSQTEEGQNACAFIEDNFRPNDEVVTSSATLHASLLVVQQVFQHCREAILDSINSLNEEDGIDIRYKELRNGNCSIDITCEHVDSLFEVRRELNTTIQGKRMNKDDFQNIHELFTRAGRYEMRRLMETTKTLIIDDYRTLEISIYGEQERQEEAYTHLEDYLRRLSTGVSRILSLRGPDKPFGVIKELFVRFNVDLLKLRIKIKGLHCVQVDLKTHTVKLNGTTEAVDEASAEIKSVIEHLQNLQGQSIMEVATHQCAICFMQIEEGELYRLEVCGHPFCTSCIIPQFESAFGNVDFPLLCCREGCLEPWSWRDLMSISLKSGIAINDLVNRATSSFIATHDKQYKYCTSPDCPSIYRVTADSEEFLCNECGVRICTACNTQFHNGLTCEEVKEIREDSSGIKIWLSKDPKNRKLCPECGLPIEKAGGCHHMECSKCRRHICWLCLKHYGSSGECYGHLRSVHGGYGGGY